MPIVNGTALTQHNFLSCYETAQIIHEKYDPLDEIALGFKVRALNKMRGYKRPRKEFEQFKKRYARIMDDKYSRTFKEVTNL